jgi:hypothetical protein
VACEKGPDSLGADGVNLTFPFILLSYYTFKLLQTVLRYFVIQPNLLES